MWVLERWWLVGLGGAVGLVSVLVVVLVVLLLLVGRAVGVEVLRCRWVVVAVLGVERRGCRGCWLGERCGGVCVLQGVELALLEMQLGGEAVPGGGGDVGLVLVGRHARRIDSSGRC